MTRSGLLTRTERAPACTSAAGVFGMPPRLTAGRRHSPARQTDRMDPRLRAAVDASVRWYDDVFALHRIPVRVEDGLWVALRSPPPWHSAVKTLQPGIETGRAARAVAGFEHCSVADSFADLDLEPHGFTV